MKKPRCCLAKKKKKMDMQIYLFIFS